MAIVYSNQDKVRCFPLHSLSKQSSPNPRGGGGGGGGGGTLIFYIYIGLADFFFWVKILKFSFLGGFQKNHYFWGVVSFLRIFFGGLLIN